MSGLASLGRSLRSAASAALDRIRRVLPGRLGTAGSDDGRGRSLEGADGDARAATGGGGAVTHRSIRRRSSTALEDPTDGDRGAEPPGDEGKAGSPDGLPPAPAEGSGALSPGPDPLDGLGRRDRPLADPADDERNGTRTEGERRPDGRFRIVDDQNPDAYLESDASVALDHHR